MNANESVTIGMANKAYRAALELLATSRIVAVPNVALTGRKQRAYLKLVQDSIEYPEVITDTVISRYCIDFESVMEKSAQESFGYFGINPIYWDRRILIPTTETQLVDGYLKYMLSEIWGEYLWRINRQIALSIDHPSAYKLEITKLCPANKLNPSPTR